MQTYFDLIDAINTSIIEHRERTGSLPRSISVSPASYCRLVEFKAWEERIGNLVIGCFPVKMMMTGCGLVPLVIDEFLADTAVVID